MALEVYVMPLARYLVGDFEPAPLPEGEERYERPREDVSPEEAAVRVSAMQDAMSDSLGRPVRWVDEGDVEFAQCIDVRVLHGLRSLAAAHEYPRRFLFLRLAFRLLDDPRDHPSLRKIYDGENTAFAHLMRHSDNRGFWFPVDYGEPAESNEPQWWRIGSAQGLRRELEELGPLLAQLPDGPDRNVLEEGRVFFMRAAGASIERQLPMIIEG
jgi:hypothetical protein